MLQDLASISSTSKGVTMNGSISAADLERSRLLNLIKAVFERRHYDPSCSCSQCQSTRDNVKGFDRAFIDDVADVFKTLEPLPDSTAV